MGGLPSGRRSRRQRAADRCKQQPDAPGGGAVPAGTGSATRGAARTSECGHPADPGASSHRAGGSIGRTTRAETGRARSDRVPARPQRVPLRIPGPARRPPGDGATRDAPPAGSEQRAAGQGPAQAAPGTSGPGRFPPAATAAAPPRSASDSAPVAAASRRRTARAGHRICPPGAQGGDAGQIPPPCRLQPCRLRGPQRARRRTPPQAPCNLHQPVPLGPGRATPPRAPACGSPTSPGVSASPRPPAGPRGRRRSPPPPRR